MENVSIVGDQAGNNQGELLRGSPPKRTPSRFGSSVQPHSRFGGRPVWRELAARVSYAPVDLRAAAPLFSSIFLSPGIATEEIINRDQIQNEEVAFECHSDRDTAI
jgi:hypothetical protein